MKIINKVKLGLAGLVLAGAGMFGCSSTAQKIQVEPLPLKVYTEEVSKENVNFQESDGKEINGTYSPVEKVADSSEIYTSDSKVNESEDKTHFLNWNIYALQRDQAKGESKPDWVRGIGTKANVEIGNGFNLYGKWEHDEKERTTTSPVGQLTSNSNANTYGVGLGYSVNPTEWLELGADAGVFKRETKHNILGHVGSTSIDQTRNTSYLGAEAGIYANLKLSDNVWLHGHYNFENHNPGNARENVNTSTAYKAGLGVNFKW